MIKRAIAAVFCFAVSLGSAHAAEVIHIYGPGGPAPAMKAAAKAYGDAHGVEVIVTAGPTDAWADDFKKDGDLIYSGSEAMMSDFVTQFGGAMLDGTIESLYLRPAAILVRPGNPRHVGGFTDLLKPGMRVMVVNGAGQVGMWEDIAGRDGDIRTLQALRHNIVFYAPNSAKAKARWTQDASVDAWIIYAIWAKANPGIADVVPLDADHAIYRDCGVALTAKGQKDAATTGFVAFLKSPEGYKIFARYGWSDHAPTH
ncbi:substrate-binding domain-containing protein [Xanthomonas sp. NCPPB 2632]|uniref:substrate-binding domain-containing protein n=1 Tax=Xanthomonas sp. NCPPB 2632 TaxID=3240912 RepID=UPI0035137C8C